MKKTNIINIVVVVLVLALIGFMVWNNNKDSKKVDDSNDNSSVIDIDASGNEAVDNGNSSNGDFVPPTGEWQSAKTVSGEISFDIPSDYYVSHPVIGECDDVTSISTQTANTPTISVALIYKAGCVKDNDVLANFTRQEIKNGYVFQTSAGSPAVLAVYDRIVASVK